MPLTPLTSALAIQGPLSAAQLRSALGGVSRATLMRRVAEHREEVVALGASRAIRYALRRRLPGLPAQLPLYRVDETGEVAQVASIIPVATHGT